MLKALFKKNQIKSLYILGTICLNKEKTMTSIASILELPYSTVKRTLPILKEDLSAFFPDEQVFIEEKETVMLNETFYSRRFLPLLKLSRYYLNDSVNALLLEQVMTNTSLNIIELSNRLSISQSYCYTIINQLNHSLKKYQLSISAKNNIVSLSGHNTRIIVFAYLFKKYQHQLNPELQQTFIKQLKLDRNLSPQEKEAAYRLGLFKDIFNSRGRPQHCLVDYNKTIDEINQVFSSYHDFFPDIDNLITDEEQALKHSVNTAIALIVYKIEDPKIQSELGGTLQDLNNPITNLAANICASFIYRFKLTKFQDDPLAYNLLYFHIITTLLYVHYFNIDHQRIFYPKAIDIFKDTDTENDSSPEFLLIQTFIEQLPISDPLWKKSLSENHREKFYRIFYAAFHYSTSPSVSIYIDMSATIDGLYLFKQKIKTIFSSDTFTYTDDPKNADLVCIDHLKHVETSGKIILIYDLRNEQNWQNIFSLILSEYFNKVETYTKYSRSTFFVN